MSEKMARLIELETRLESMLESARQEAAELVGEAEQEALGREESFHRTASAAWEALRETLDAEHERELVAVRERRHTDVARFRDVSSDTLERLAAFVVQRLTSGHHDGGTV